MKHSSWRTLRPPKVAAQFDKSVTFASTSERFPIAFVVSAMTVQNRILNIGACRGLLTKLDSDYGTGSPLNSVYKLQAIVNKCRTPANIEAVIAQLVWGFEAGLYEADDMSVKKLREHMVDLMLLKKAMLRHFLDSCFQSLRFPPEDVNALRRSYETPSAVNKYVKAGEGAAAPAVYWQPQLSKPAHMFGELVDVIVYDSNMDSSLKHALKYSKGPTAILTDYQACIGSFPPPTSSRTEVLRQYFANSLALAIS